LAVDQRFGNGLVVIAEEFSFVLNLFRKILLVSKWLLQHAARDIEVASILNECLSHDGCHKVDEPAINFDPCMKAFCVVNPLVIHLATINDHQGGFLIDHESHASGTDRGIQAIVVSQKQHACLLISTQK